MSWADEVQVGFDTETTGVDPRVDRIVTAAIVIRIPGGQNQVRTWLIDPLVEIPASAEAVHGISTEHARSYGRHPALAVDELATVLARYLADGRPVVAYNASYDLALLDTELRRHQLPTLAERIGGPVAPILDPLVIDRWQVRKRFGKRRLGDLVGHYRVAVAGDLHSADADVLATLDVLAAQVRAFPQLAQLTPHQLHRAQEQAHREWAEEFSQWLASQGANRPGPNPQWLVP